MRAEDLDPSREVYVNANSDVLHLIKGCPQMEPGIRSKSASLAWDNTPICEKCQDLAQLQDSLADIHDF